MKLLAAFQLMVLLHLSILTNAQEVPRDTSYTLSSTYRKLSKTYPDISKVEINIKGISAFRDLTYSKGDKRPLSANLFRPDTSKKLPAVLLVHGGGWKTGDKSLLEPLAIEIAKKGYVTVVIEYRLSLESTYPAAVFDIKEALRWMRAKHKKYNIDQNRIALLGTSAGGQLAALVGTTNGKNEFEQKDSFRRHSSKVQAIIDIDGVLAFRHPDSQEGSMAAEWLGGTASSIPNIWDEASALSHVDKNTPPVLFIGSSYPRFLAGRQDVIRILNEYKTYHESYTLKGSPHSFWLFEPWFTPTLNYTVNFLDRVFKN